MKKRITLILTVVAAVVFAAVAPGAAKAWTSSNPAAPDSPPPYILGENSYQYGASVDFGTTYVPRLSWYSGTQLVTVTDRVWSNTPLAWKATGWSFVDSRTFNATLYPGYYVRIPEAHIPVSTLRANFYGADLIVTWKATTGVVLATDRINYDSLSDYSCAAAYPECSVTLNKDGLGANLYFATHF
jgi:hypothetical protein